VRVSELIYAKGTLFTATIQKLIEWAN